jgi:predicted transcriptional regulator
MLICALCGNTFEKVLGLSIHLRKSHDISLEEYEEKYGSTRTPKIDIRQKVTCAVCGKEFVYLAPHVQRKHGVSTEEYRKIYGGPTYTQEYLAKILPYAIEKGKRATARLIEYNKSEEGRKKSSEAAKIWSNNPAYKEKLRVRKRAEFLKAWESQEFRIKQAEANSARMSDLNSNSPEWKAKRLAVLSDEEHKAAQAARGKILMTELNKDPQFRQKSRSSQGSGKPYKDLTMRSSWEVSVAEFLDAAGYEWDYEVPKDLGTCTYYPDFYVKELDTYIEVKGPHLLDTLWKVDQLREQGCRVTILQKPQIKAIRQLLKITQAGER